MGVAVGTRFGELTTTTVPWREKHGAVVACECSCGRHFVARVENLQSGYSDRCRVCKARTRLSRKVGAGQPGTPEGSR